MHVNRMGAFPEDMLIGVTQYAEGAIGILFKCFRVQNGQWDIYGR